MNEVRYDVADGVAVITLAAEARRNALTPTMAAELVAAFDAADDDSAVGAVVVGGGRSFCAGADLSTLGDIGADPAGEEAYRQLDAVYEVFLRLGRVAAPTIAAVRGAAVGAGLNLALATDLRVVADDARLMSGFGRIGAHPGGGHLTLLRRSGGRELAAAAGLFGVQLSGREAADRGLAWAAVPDDEVDSTALALARVPATDPALARRTAATFRRETDGPMLPWDLAVEVERGPQLWSFRRRSAGG